MKVDSGLRSKIALVYFNVSLFCVLLLGLELAGQVAFYCLKGYPVYRSAEHVQEELSWHQQLLERHPYLVGRLRGSVRAEREGKVASTTPNHTRWTGAASQPGRAIRVATLGGSTTFGAGLSDEETWPARLQALLGPRYAVTNYGLLGYSTAEGVIQMALLVPESQPDIVVFYEGWNDIRNYHSPDLGPDYFAHGINQFTTLEIAPSSRETPFSRLASVSALGHLAMVITKPPAPTRSSNAGVRLWTEPDSTVDRLYVRNLRTMRGLASRMGAYTLMVPQVLNDDWYRTHQGSDWWSPLIDNQAMPRLIARLSRLMSDACGPSEADCSVLEGIRTGTWGSSDFLDEGHFSPMGSDRFAHAVAARVQQIVAGHPELTRRINNTTRTSASATVPH